eukprot:5293046-Prymnesium_polylepis.1
MSSRTRGTWLDHQTQGVSLAKTLSPCGTYVVSFTRLNRTANVTLGSPRDHVRLFVALAVKLFPRQIL